MDDRVVPDLLKRPVRGGQGQGGAAGSGGAFGPYYPAEQALIAGHAGDADRTTVFAGLSLVGVLAAAGITEASMGCPIRSSMEVIQVGTTATGFPVYQDRNASQSDGVLVVNRVKPHTGFTECVESGLCKMLVIGLGKQAGASKIHQQALRVELGRMVLEASRIILESGQMRFLGGLALVQNAFHETAQVQCLALDDHGALVAAESKLLKRAYGLMARLPFEDLDGLIVDEMGKNISGAGFDPNVTGRPNRDMAQWDGPHVKRLVVLDLTEETHGNATGLGLAAIVNQRFFPPAERDEFAINVWMPEGTRLEATDKVVRRIEDYLKKDSEVRAFASFVGVGAPRFFFPVLPVFSPTTSSVFFRFGLNCFWCKA